MNRRQLVDAYLKHLEATYVEEDAAEPPSRERFDRLVELQSKKIEADPYFWAWEELEDLSLSDPSEAFEVLLEIISRAPRLQFLSSIGTGPLEELLNEHAELLQTRIEEELRANQRFREAFVFGRYFEVPAPVIERWIEVFEQLGLSKESIWEEFRRKVESGE